MVIHVSDCNIHDNGACDCGGLKLADYPAKGFCPTLIASTGRFGFFVDHMGGECFVEEHRLPADTLIAIAAAANLPDAHGLIAGSGDTNGVDLHHTRESVIAKLKAFAAAQGLAGDIPVHVEPSVDDMPTYTDSPLGLSTR